MAPSRARPRRRSPRRRPGTKQAYALSFSPLGDERLRYRVARWVVDRAPAHALTEVQEDLAHGTFVTFLALTADEAEVAREGIHGLGVAPAPPPRARLDGRDAPPRAPGTGEGEACGRVRRLAHTGRRRRGLLVFGLVVVRLIGGRGF